MSPRGLLVPVARSTPRRVRAGTAVGVAAGIGLVGLSGWLAAYVLDPAGALRAWLAAWTYGLSIALGALCLVMIAHVTGAMYLVVLRRLAEATAMSLPILGVGALPMLLDAALLYPWARPLPAPEELLGRFSEIPAWLDPTFVSIRAILYLCVWVALTGWLWRASIRSDASAGRARRRGASRRATVGVSAAGLIMLALTVTAAALDWLMSLAPSWLSAVSGVYWFAGGMAASLSALVLVARGLQSAGVLGDVVADAHYYALGRLLLALVVFWACIACVQGFIVWIGDVPADVEWYVTGGGGAVLLVLGVVHFVPPFLILLSGPLKRSPRPLAWVAAWLLAAHWVDTRWLSGSILRPPDLLPGWVDIAALVAVVGLGAACSAWVLDGKALIPLGDPRLKASIR